MDLTEHITIVEKILFFFNIEHRNISVVILILIVLTLLYVLKTVRGLKTSCKGLDCTKATRAIEKAATIDNRLQDMEKLVIELKSESFLAHSQLKRDLDRFDRYLDDLKQNSTELHGILVGSGKSNSGANRRRIIHHDD